LKLAETIKEKVKREINELRALFEKIQQENRVGSFALSVIN